MIGTLFTADFLERGIKDSPAWRALDDASFRTAKAELGALYAGFPVTAEVSEAQTEDRLIFPIMEALGWRYRHRQPAMEAGRRNVPDAMFFLAEQDREAADRETRHENKVRYADLILEAKRWNVPFDTRVDRETPPMAQLLAYLPRRDAVGPSCSVGHPDRWPQVATLLSRGEVATQRLP